jgi:predicted RNase H-like HicB family nuclease
VSVAGIQAQFKLFGVIRRDGRWYVAHCPPLDLTTQGRSAEEAKRNLREAAELFFTSCLERGTLDQALRELGFVGVERAARRIPHDAFEMTIPLPLRFQKPDPCPA